MVGYLRSNNARLLTPIPRELQIPAYYVTPDCGKQWTRWAENSKWSTKAGSRIQDLGTKEAVNLSRHDEVALGQAVDFMGPEGDPDLAPSKQNVRMMSLLFGQRTHPVYEIQCLLEVREGKRSGHMVFVNDFPVGPLRQLLVNVSQFLAFEGRHSASAGNTGFGIERHWI